MIDVLLAPRNSGFAGRSPLALLPLAAWLLLPIAALADDAQSGDAYRFGEVIVVTGRSKGVEAAGSVATVTSEEIDSRGARTLDEALRLVPGVNVRVGGEGVPRIDIRGFRTRHVLLLLDGIPLNSAVDEQFDPTLIPTESVASIKVTEGPASVLYGQGGLGGVVNIVSKSGATGLGGAVSGEAGDHAPYLARARVSGGEGPLCFFASGSSARTNAFPLAEGFAPTALQPARYRYNSDRRRANVLGNLTYAPVSGLALGFTGSYAHVEYGKPTSAIDNPFDPFASPPRFDRVPGSDQVALQAAVDYQAKARLRVRGWAYLNRLKEEDDRYDDASFRTFAAAGSFRQRVDSTVSGASLQPKYDLGAAGAVGFLLSGERDAWSDTGLTTIGPGVAPAPTDARNTLHLYSLAVEYEVSPANGLGLVAGYGRHWQLRSGGRRENDFAALGAAYYDVLPGTRLKASIGRNIRFPSLADLYEPGRGNPALAAERANTAAAGVEQRLARDATLGLTAFYTQAKNLIQTDQASGLAANLADVRFAGFEVSGAARSVKALAVRASYAFLRSEDRSRPGRQEQQYTPRHKASVAAIYRFAFGLEPSLAISFVGDQLYYTRNAITPVQKGKLADCALVDLKLTQRLVRERLAIYAGATNLLDESYETSYGFPQAGRFVYGGIELRM